MERSIVGLTAAMVHYFRRPPHSISPAKSGRGGFRACVGQARALRRVTSSPNDLPPVTDHPSLAEFSRVVVKVGSSLLVDRVRGALKQEWLDALVADIAALHERGADVLVVSSGAIALGRTIAGLHKGLLKPEDSQAAAAIGQIALA